MKLYHGSKDSNLATIKKMQAGAGEGVQVPKDELLEAIYLTPDYGFALAMAARPEGVTHIDDEKHTIEFEDPTLFDPEKMIYVYELDVPDDEVRAIDKLQFVAENKSELKPTNMFTHKAGDLEQYYELKNWKKESDIERGFEPRMRR